jgi:hypothetical protein
MGKLFVTVFAFASAPKTNFVITVTPGHAHLHAIKILHHDNFLAPRQITPRHCASAFFQLHLPGLFPGRLSNLYRDRALTQ